MPAPPPRCSLLVTGGAGYIGSHCAEWLARSGHRVVVLDSLENGHSEAVERAAELSGSEIPLVEGDLAEASDLDRAWARGPFNAVLHFAALKSVPDSFERPEAYLHTNVQGTAALTEAMSRYGCRRLVYSSSAAVYGDLEGGRASEDSVLAPTSPYGETKAQGEEVIARWVDSSNGTAVALRYFNPVGAHPSGRMGEDPRLRTNLGPVLLDVALNRSPYFHIFGDDYDTPDGTCIRDYVHIMDLAEVHEIALTQSAKNIGFEVYNVGTGHGSSVLEVLAAARTATGHPIPYQRVARREGDIPELVAQVDRIKSGLGWNARYGLDDMLASAWAWCRAHPSGYRP